MKSFFAQEAKEWKNRVIAEIKSDDTQEEAAEVAEVEVPEGSPSEVDNPSFADTETPEVVDATEGEEIADVSKEALNVEVGETAGESPEVPEVVDEATPSETPSETVAETVDTPETPEEKSVSFEKKAFDEMQSKIADLEAKQAKSDEVNLKLIELVSAMNDEVKTLRSVVAKIPMKK